MSEPDERTQTTIDDDVSVGLAEATTITTATTVTRLDLLGISVHYLSTTLVDEIRASGRDINVSNIHDLEDLTGPPGFARRKGADVVSPVDGRLGASYVHCLFLDNGNRNNGINNNKINNDDDDIPAVSKADYMLSYSWSYVYADIISALMEFCKLQQLNPKQMYIWMDVLCINQHRVVEAKENGGTGLLNFEETFPEQLSQMGHVLAMMAPSWKEPVYLTRIWCIFEIYMANELAKKQTDNSCCCCQVSIIMPARERVSLKSELFGYDIIDATTSKTLGIPALYEKLGQNKVQNAKATFAKDRDFILGMIEKNHQGDRGGGCDALNETVNEFLRAWVRSVVREVVGDDDDDDTGAAAADHTNGAEANHQMAKIGTFLRRNGQLEDAMRWYTKCLHICEGVFGTDHVNTAKCHVGIGSVLDDKGDYDGAMVAYQKALNIRKLKMGDGHPDTALTYIYV